MIILKGGQGYPGTPAPTASEANPLIFCLTTPIPRSSLALSSITCSAEEISEMILGESFKSHEMY
eukprot:475358-Prorocentrum_minimum.AAC.1